MPPLVLIIISSISLIFYIISLILYDNMMRQLFVNSFADVEMGA